MSATAVATLTPVTYKAKDVHITYDRNTPGSIGITADTDCVLCFPDPSWFGMTYLALDKNKKRVLTLPDSFTEIPFTVLLKCGAVEMSVEASVYAKGVPPPIRP